MSEYTYDIDKYTISVDDKIYKDFQMYALMINKSVSSLIEEYMKETLKKVNKNDIK